LDFRGYDIRREATLEKHLMNSCGLGLIKYNPLVSILAGHINLELFWLLRKVKYRKIFLTKTL
jgi:hypothetical protein